MVIPEPASCPGDDDPPSSTTTRQISCPAAGEASSSRLRGNHIPTLPPALLHSDFLSTQIDVTLDIEVKSLCRDGGMRELHTSEPGGFGHPLSPTRPPRALVGTSPRGSPGARSARSRRGGPHARRGPRAAGVTSADAGDECGAFSHRCGGERCSAGSRALGALAAQAARRARHATRGGDKHSGGVRVCTRLVDREHSPLAGRTGAALLPSARPTGSCSSWRARRCSSACRSRTCRPPTCRCRA